MLAESGESGSKASNFDAIAYVHASENPSFRLLEEKTVPNLVDKFWHGVNEFVEGATLIWQSINLDGEDLHEVHRFEECKKFRNYRGGSMSAKAIERLLEEKTVPNLVDKFWHGVNEFVEGATLIWQSINLDGEDLHEDALHRFEECKKFRNYRGGSMSAKAIEIEHEKNRDKVTAIGEEEGASNERCGSCLAKPCKCVMPSYYLSSKTI